MKYDHYSVLDFVKDEEFQRWVKSPDERTNFYWHSWMHNHKDKIHLLNEAREIINSMDFPGRSASQEMMQEVFQKVLKNERPVTIERIEIQHRERLFQIRKNLIIAASLLILLTTGYILYNLNLPSESIPEVIANEEIIKENAPGQKSTFHLSDGSVIKLNASSRLIVPDSFGIVSRDVFLEGEAFFDIAKDAQKPFLVHTGDLSTLVTGTAFNVRAYDENNIRVAVSEGQVEAILCCEESRDTLTLSKPFMGVYDKTSNKLSKTTYNYLETMGWKDGVIYFENVSSWEAFEYLERWYGVKIYIENQDRIPGAFYGEFKNEILENVLMAMSKALQFEYKIDTKNVLIKPIKNE